MAEEYDPAYVVPAVMGKLSIRGYGRLGWYCPACDMLHVVNVEADTEPRWSWNLQYIEVTFSPSIDVKYSWGPERTDVHCHVFVRDGNIHYLNDCTHEYSGKTIALPDIPEDWK